MATLADLLALQPATLPRYEGTLAEALLGGWSGKGQALPPEFSDWAPPMPGKRGISDFAGAFIPLEQNSAGERRLALPAVIKGLPQVPQALADLMKRAATGAYRPTVEDPMTGRMYDPSLYEDARTLAQIAMTGTMPIPKPINSLGMFGGELARTADKAALKTAKEMAEKGATREDIWNATGWFQGKDGKWRFEIDDSQSRMNTNAAGLGQAAQRGPVARGLQHEPLYDAYPDMGALPASLQMRAGDLEGTYWPPKTVGNRLVEGLSVEAATKNDMHSALLHELQHAIQTREYFARGGSPDEMNVPQDELWAAAKQAYQDASNVDADALLAELMDQPAPPLKGPVKPWDELTHRQKVQWLQSGRDLIYHRLAGEVEARNVQTRMKMTPAKRKATPPWLTEDIDAALQIIRSRE